MGEAVGEQTVKVDVRKVVQAELEDASVVVVLAARMILVCEHWSSQQSYYQRR